jgi:hypothetical protein
MNKRWMSVVAIAMIVVGFSSARAQEAAAAPKASGGSSGFGYRGWGPRVGLASDPDQFLVGVHWDLGEFAPKVAFRPDVVLGVGDDVTSLAGSAAVWYRFEGASSEVTPYAGGALVVGVFDVDNPGNDDDDSDVEIGLQVGGGGEWDLKSGNRFLAELRFDLGDVWEVAAFAGWTF